MNSFVESIVQVSLEARNRLAQDSVLNKYIDWDLPCPRPFLGPGYRGKIKLVIIGQDPTVQNTKSRAQISTVLNLNKDGSLRRYLSGICSDLGLELDADVYATNLCKCFFKSPPTTIEKQENINVLTRSISEWLPILEQELAKFPDALVISLGEPLLSTLVRTGYPQQVGYYWGKTTKPSRRSFRYQL
jgi:uracil-DNA glycosylase